MFRIYCRVLSQGFTHFVWMFNKLGQNMGSIGGFMDRCSMSFAGGYELVRVLFDSADNRVKVITADGSDRKGRAEQQYASNRDDYEFQSHGFFFSILGLGGGRLR